MSVYPATLLTCNESDIFTLPVPRPLSVIDVSSSLLSIVLVRSVSLITTTPVPLADNVKLVSAASDVIVSAVTLVALTVPLTSKLSFT